MRKSPDLLCDLSASYRPRKSKGLVLVQVLKPENQVCWWCSSHLKGSRHESQKELMFQFKCESGKLLKSQGKSSQTGKNYLFLQTVSQFPSNQALTDWIRPTHISKGITLLLSLDFPGGSDCKMSAYNEGDLGSIPGSGRSGEGNGNPQRSLVGYSSWGCRKSDKTELSFFLPTLLDLLIMLVSSKTTLTDTLG